MKISQTHNFQQQQKTVTYCHVTWDDKFLCSGQCLVKELPVTEDLLQLCHVDAFRCFCVRQTHYCSWGCCICMCVQWSKSWRCYICTVMKVKSVFSIFNWKYFELGVFWIWRIWWKCAVIVFWKFWNGGILNVKYFELERFWI